MPRAIWGKRSALTSNARWRKSRYSTLNGCVEVSVVDGMVTVRGSKDRTGHVLRFRPDEWEAFLAGVRSGEFDLVFDLA
jgi:hypothetical protein